MKVVILYRENEEYTRSIEEFARAFKGAYSNIELELKDLNTSEGDEMAKLYDIVDYPAILVLREDGQVQNVWQGSNLPLLDEVESYVR